jgi:L-ascorbate metabolism protein UlaG (beta-lactamase superfamily)
MELAMKTRLPFLLIFLVLGMALSACQSQPPELTLHYFENAQVELSTGSTPRVFIDVYNSSVLTAPPTENDILLTTHAHPDHIQQDFLDTFPGQQLFIQEGEITVAGISITGIAATHTAYGNDEFLPTGGSNYIYLVEMGDFRIAHFGDIGQEELTAEQLEVLGEVDIAISQFVNSFSQMDNYNEKGFNLMGQLQPQMIIPAHGNSNMKAMTLAAERWHVYTTPEIFITVTKSDLTPETQMVIMGIAAESMGTILDVPTWGAE